jgi:molybdopterin/thiamine biosynthesis adenylyltransferase
MNATVSYEDLIHRNLGIFTREQQERLRSASVLIVGCGGIGGTVGTILARSGIGRFTLVEPESFEPTNLNRQICCFTDTLGRNKAEVLRESILRINPEAKAEAFPSVLPLPRVVRMAEACDLVFPAADDYAYSVMVFRLAREAGKPALMIVPSGFWSIVTLIPPSGTRAEDMHGVPPVETYEELRDLFSRKEYKLATWFYPWLGGWRKEYYREFIEEEAPMAQICPVVWLGSSLGALEAVKLLSGREKPVTAPWFWSITRDGVEKQRLGRLNLQSLMLLHRKIAWRIFHGPLGGVQSALQKIWWERWFNR